MSGRRIVGTLWMVVGCAAFGFFRCCEAEEAAKGAAIKPGDKLRVINGPAPVKTGEKTLATFDTGTELEALDVQGDWVQVKVAKEDSVYTGWIKSAKYLQSLSANPAEETKAGPREAPETKGPTEQPKGIPSEPTDRSKEKWQADVQVFFQEVTQALAEVGTPPDPQDFTADRSKQDRAGEALRRFRDRHVRWRLTYLGVRQEKEATSIEIEEKSNTVLRGTRVIIRFAVLPKDGALPKWRSLQRGASVLCQARIGPHLGAGILSGGTWLPIVFLEDAEPTGALSAR